MRLLYVCSDFGIKPNGVKGASIHLRAITRGLSGLGHDVRILSPYPGPDHDHPAVPLFSDTESHGIHESRKLRDWLRDRRLNESAGNELRPLLYNANIVQPALAAMGNWKPDAVIERLSLFGHVGADLAAALGVPHVVEVNAILTQEAKRYRSLELCTLAEQIERRILKNADAVIAVSEPLAERIVELGVSPANVCVVPNGFDPHMFEALPSREQCAESFGINGSFVIGFSGSLKAWHGVDLLLAAFAEFHNRISVSRLLIVGTGPMEISLREQAKGIANPGVIIFTGALPHNRVPTALRAMDIAVAPFRYQDDFYFSPIKLFEYMASGACVVASRLGQICDVIEDGGDGLLCKPDSISDLLEKLLRLHSAREMRNKLASRAARRVREHFTWQHAAERTEAVVAQAVAMKPTRARPQTNYQQDSTTVQS